MLGSAKPRRLDEPITVSLEELLPHDHSYRHLEATLDLGFVREWTRELYAERGRPVPAWPRRLLPHGRYRMAMGRTQEPVAPCSFSGEHMKQKATTSAARSGSRSIHSSRWTPRR